MAPRRAQGAEWLPDTCSKADLAVILDISTRAVSDWDTRGVLVRAAAGRYQTLASIRNYVAALREKKANRAAGSDGSASQNLAAEKAKKAAFDARIREIELAKLEGNVLTSDEVTELWSTWSGRVKATFMSLAGTLASQIPHITLHDQATIKRVCRDKLRDLASDAADMVPAAEAADLSDDESGV